MPTAGLQLCFVLPVLPQEVLTERCLHLQHEHRRLSLDVPVSVGTECLRGCVNLATAVGTCSVTHTDGCGRGARATVVLATGNGTHVAANWGPCATLGSRLPSDPFTGVSPCVKPDMVSACTKALEEALAGGTSPGVVFVVILNLQDADNVDSMLSESLRQQLSEHGRLLVVVTNPVLRSAHISYADVVATEPKDICTTIEALLVSLLDVSRVTIRRQASPSPDEASVGAKRRRASNDDRDGPELILFARSVVDACSECGAVSSEVDHSVSVNAVRLMAHHPIWEAVNMEESGVQNDIKFLTPGLTVFAPDTATSRDWMSHAERSGWLLRPLASCGESQASNLPLALLRWNSSGRCSVCPAVRVGVWGEHEQPPSRFTPTAMDPVVRGSMVSMLREVMINHTGLDPAWKLSLSRFTGVFPSEGGGGAALLEQGAVPAPAAAAAATFVRACALPGQGEKSHSVATEFVARWLRPNTSTAAGAIQSLPKKMCDAAAAASSAAASVPTSPRALRLQRTVSAAVEVSLAEPANSGGAQQSTAQKNTPTLHVPRGRLGRRVYDVVKKDSSGQVVYPIVLSTMLKVMNLGSVVYDEPAFHNERYIWPLGYKAIRSYHSLMNMNDRCDYLCEVADSGGTPLFKITAMDESGAVFAHNSASGVWQLIVKRASEMREAIGEKPLGTAISGPDYYGLAYPEIKRAIQELPNADKCSGYKWQDYSFLGETVVTGAAEGQPSATQSALSQSQATPVKSETGDSRDEKPAAVVTVDRSSLLGIMLATNLIN